MLIEDKDLRSQSPARQRTHLSAVIASLVASLLLLFGGDVFGRSHVDLSSNGAMSRSNAGHATAGGLSETRFLASPEQSARPKLRPTTVDDGCLAPDIQTLWMCRHGYLVQRAPADRALANLPLPYWSRAPPTIPHIA